VGREELTIETAHRSQ